MILALAGGVGGAKLAHGLAKLLEPDQLLVVVNTGDDFEHLGLPISPDLDTVTYKLAGINNPDTGWGLIGESWAFMSALESLGGESWFRLGDRDLATHVIRAKGLREGNSLSKVTADIASHYGILHRIVPMSDHPVRTIVETDIGDLPFQIYFVREKCEPITKRVKFEGANNAFPSELFMEALNNEAVNAIVICPSNPILSIAPILALSGVRKRLRSHPAPLIAVSPIIAGRAVKGPTAKIFEEMKMDSSALGVANYYHDVLDGIVIDSQDAHLAASISSKGIDVITADILMNSTSDQVRLAGDVLEFAQRLRKVEVSNAV